MIPIIGEARAVPRVSQTLRFQARYGWDDQGFAKAFSHGSADLRTLDVFTATEVRFHLSDRLPGEKLSYRLLLSRRASRR